MWAFFAVSLVAVVSTIVGLLRRYAAPSVPYVVLLATAYAWLTSFSIVVLVPIDVWTTLAKRPNSAINVMWAICYWSTQVGYAWGVLHTAGFHGFTLTLSHTYLWQMMVILLGWW